jgi:hypothetical protein
MSLQTRLTSLAQAVGADIKELNGRVLVSAPVPLDIWHRVGTAGEPAFLNGGHYDPVTYSPVSFRKFLDGRVQLRGLYLTGPTSTVAFTLPTGYWPGAGQMMFNCLASAPGQARVDVYANGQIFVSSMAPNSWVSFDVIEFDTALVTEMPTGPQGASGQAAGKIFYQAPSDPSDIAGYKTLLPSPSSGAEQTIASVCTGTSDVLIGSFATDPGVPGAVDYPAGTAYRRIYAMVSAGAARLHLQVFKRDLAGVETLVRDEYSDPFSSTVATAQMWTATAPTAGALLATDRLVSKVYAQRVSGPTSITVTTFYEGTTHASQIQTTISTGAQGAKGDKGDTGGNATVPMDPWHTVGAVGEPAFGTNWSTYTAGVYAPVGFKKDPLGRVHLRGVLLSAVAQTANAGTTAFQLPNGYRPPYRVLLDATETIGQKSLVINPDGTITSGMALAAGNGLLLDGLYFDTDTVTEMPTGPQGPAGATGGNATVPLDPWHNIGAVGEPIFQNNWAATAGHQPPAFRKMPDGTVQLRGMLGGGTMGQAMFTLPVSCWPKKYVNVMSSASYSAPNYTPGYIQIYPNGVVLSNTGTNYQQSLDSIFFDTETVTQMPTGPAGPTGSMGGSTTVPMDPWHIVGAVGEPAFTPGSNWVNYGGGYGNARFRKYPDGRVKLAGLVRAGSGVIFTLPAGYKPPGVILAYTVIDAGGVAQVSISANGDVAAGALSGTTTNVFLDGVEFDTETVTQLPIGPAGPINGVQQAGIDVAVRPKLNFKTPLTAVDNPANNSVDIAALDSYGQVLQALGVDVGSGSFQTIGPTPAEVQDRGTATLRLTIPAHPTLPTRWEVSGGCLIDAGASAGVWIMPEIGIWEVTGAGVIVPQARVQTHSTMSATGQVFMVITPSLLTVAAATPRSLRLVGKTWDGYSFRAITGTQPLPSILARQVGGPIVR